jgi:leucyl aminopeptidase
MTDFEALLRPDRGENARTIHVVDQDSWSAWSKKQPAARRDMLAALRFDATSPFQFALLQGKGPGEFEVVTCVPNTGRLGPWCLAKLGESLPAGSYRLAGAELGQAGLGWLLAQHRFDRYKKSDQPIEPRVLLTADAAAIDRTVRMAEATALVRDLVDTPAADMGPAELEAAARALADRCGAKLAVVGGDALAQDYPMIAAVGGGAVRERAPRLIELDWGKAADPLVAIVGKGVCFDTGGLDIKPAAGMRLMKKDMGGAAHALALAGLIMDSRLPIRLKLLVPAVENAVSAGAYRPGDVIVSRNGLTVEVDNTDAEGRLVLADALDRAVADKPALLIDFATLTGAARIALGPDLPALFANDDSLAEDFLSSAAAVSDPLWRMPLWDGYDDMLKSDIADLANSADSPMAGSIVGALFLKRFVPDDVPWAHLDLFAWHPTAKPGRPKGGEALGLRAAFDLIERRFGRR